MRIPVSQIRKVMREVGCDFATAQQLIRETNSTEEAINLGKYLTGR